MKKAFFQLHIAIVLAGFTGILGKLIQLNEAYLTGYRMLLSVIILFIIFLAQKSLKFLPLKKALPLLGIGIIVAIHWVTFYGSIKYSNVSVAVTCFSAIGFFTSLLEPAINRHKVDITEVALGVLVMIGIYLIFNFYPEYKNGIIFGMISAFLGSVFPILTKGYLETHSPFVVNFYEMLGGFLALCIIIPIYINYFPAAYAIPTVSDWIWLIILAGLCTVWAFHLSLQALKKISAFTINLSYNLEPVYSIILAFIIFKENQFLGIGFYAGLSLIILAVVLQMIRVRREHYRLKQTGADNTQPL